MTPRTLAEMGRPFIAAFDIASAVGGCDGVPGSTPRVFTWLLEDGGESRPQKLCQFRRLLDQYFGSLKVDAVYYEAPMNIRAMMRLGTTDAGIALLRGAVGVLEACAVHHGIQTVEPIDVQDARQALTGKRTFARVKGKSTAKDAIAAVAKMLKVEVATEHESDAWAIWNYACAMNNPRIAHLSQPLFARL